METELQDYNRSKARHITGITLFTLYALIAFSYVSKQHRHDSHMICPDKQYSNVTNIQ